MATSLVTLENTQDIVKELEEAFFDIPFENTAFQTEKFVLAAALTPERAYRAIGLRMMSKISAVRSAKFSRLENEIDLDEIADKIANGNLNEFDVRREKLKQQKLDEEKGFSDKLIHDALVELNLLYKHFKALPRFTREEFEAAEHTHFTLRLNRDLQLNASEQSLMDMEYDMQNLLSHEQEAKKLNGGSNAESSD